MDEECIAWRAFHTEQHSMPLLHSTNKTVACVSASYFSFWWHILVQCNRSHRPLKRKCSTRESNKWQKRAITMANTLPHLLKIKSAKHQTKASDTTNSGSSSLSRTGKILKQDHIVWRLMIYTRCNKYKLWTRDWISSYCFAVVIGSICSVCGT